MKKLVTLLALAITLIATAQAPQGFNYQAIVRNTAGQLLLNQSVSFKFSILQNSDTGTVVYSENQTANTDDLGHIALVVGQGTATTGTFSSINWANGSYFLGIELNTGSGFVAMGTTQLLSVPYALHANTAGNSQASIPNLASVLAVNNGANNLQIKNLSGPSDAQDAVTKSYIDAQLQAQVAQLQAQITALQTQITAGQVAYPLLTTTAITENNTTTATAGGNITSDGNSTITARGVCWSTTANPTIALTTKTADGTGTGSFASAITGLAVNTTYYVRAYATNSFGTAYGNQVSFTTNINIAGPNVTDIDGNTYQSVTNCGLTFTKQNLNVSKYSDGTSIPQVQNASAWANLTTGAWCYYNNDPASEAVYGKLYNWYAVVGIYDAASAANPALRKKLAPAGWHVPTDSEWSSLINCLDPNADGGNNFPNIAGGKMKAIGTIQLGTGLWESPNTGATNESGFSGLPAGYRYNGGSFNSIGFIGIWWGSSESNTADAWSRYLDYDNGYALRSGDGKKDGGSVRCLRD